MTDVTTTCLATHSAAPQMQARHGPLRAGVQLPAASALKRKLLDQVRDAIRTRHYSDRTEACLPKPGAQAGGIRPLD